MSAKSTSSWSHSFTNAMFCVIGYKCYYIYVFVFTYMFWRKQRCYTDSMQYVSNYQW